MTDAKPEKTEAQRIAALESQVAELTEICANLYNALHHSFTYQVDIMKIGWATAHRTPVPEGLEASAQDAAKAMDTAMSRARELIWGEDYAQK
ncbi:MAG: hypothetical protein ACOH2H_16055 [Cypionkella sp.]